MSAGWIVGLRRSDDEPRGLVVRIVLDPEVKGDFTFSDIWENRRVEIVRAEGAPCPELPVPTSALDALRQAEACMSIVEPRSDKAEYLRILGVVRKAIARAEGRSSLSTPASEVMQGAGR